MAIYSLRLMPIGKTTQKQPYTAAAHIRYITREKAASHIMAARMPASKGLAMRWLRAQERADRKNARVADKLVLALPVELTRKQQIALVYGFAEALTKERASWFAAIHAKGKDVKNPHCHLLVRDRDVDTGKRVILFSAGPKEVKDRAAKGLAAPTTIRGLRALWETWTNAALRYAGRTERVDRRTLAEQGLARPAQVHEGPHIRAMHEQGFRPQSKPRVKRSTGVRRAGEPATRTIDYPAIDGGRTRVEYNAMLRQAGRLDDIIRMQDRERAGERLIEKPNPVRVDARETTAWVHPEQTVVRGQATEAPGPVPEAELSLTERVMRQLQVTPAEPVPEPDRERSRTRSR